MLPGSVIAAQADQVRIHLIVKDPFPDPNDPLYLAWLSVPGNAPLPEDGVFFDDYITSTYPDETAFSILFHTGLNVSYNYHQIWAGVYVNGVENWREFDSGKDSGWMYRVNGEFPAFSSSLYHLYDGDTVEWLYTRDLGEDIGGSFEGGPPPINQPGVPGGTSGNSSYLSVTPSTISISDNLLTRVTTFGGLLGNQAARFIIDDSALPVGVTVETGGQYGTNLIITGIRPKVGQPPIQGSYAVTISIENTPEIYDLDDEDVALAEYAAYAHLDYIVVTLTIGVNLTPGAPDFTYGDVNGDEIINVADTYLMKRFLAGHDVEFNTDAADVNGDGVINVADTYLMKRFLAGNNVTLGQQ